ncbi:MAG TPA: leucine--tRNA ligase [Chitinophagaceae bacterium]
MEYNFRDIEKKWQQAWIDNKVYQVPSLSDKPKYYVLDMFPYPSGSGLHVGHPLGYIASDIFARYKRLKGFNVLHPMGYDAFGLPAEQYAIEHGVHPAVSTEKNISTFRKQLDNIGFCYDWSREIRTSDPKYYKWTQWIFLQLFNSWYNRKTAKTEPIATLLAILEGEGNQNHPIPDSQFQIEGLTSLTFTAEQWNKWDEQTRQIILMEYRVAYCGYGEVNWCEALGTVLANDEVVNGVSERGGYPVVKKKLRQWYLRITEYADRLLEGLQRVDFSDAMKDMQGNWIGKSTGAEIRFSVQNSSEVIDVYTTRPDTIFGADFMVVAPEHEVVVKIITGEQRTEVEEYVAYVKSRSERERMMEKKISGAFTGAYAVHPFTGRPIPIWISEYVLAGYGTGAIMAVPSGDERDHKFAQYFNIPITNIFGDLYTGEEALMSKDVVLYNSDFLNGMHPERAINLVVDRLEQMGIGRAKVNFKMRDAAFSRQRYWGEPFPIMWKGGVAYPLDEKELPLELPFVESYKPGPEGEGPLANIPEWTERQLETNTMPGYAGSSWYFLRYMDPHNEEAFCDQRFSNYWGQVDLYVGGTEHAVGHLLYSRMWTKALYDLGHISFDEPYKRLLNQGKIGGDSRLVYRVKGGNTFVSAGLKDGYDTDELHADVNMVNGLELDIEAFKQWRPDYAGAEFILEDGKYICGTRLEKMGKRYFNVVNPDDVVERYGADTFRMYEMFLGPVEQDKPWDTKGIEGVHRFLKKLWRLFFGDAGLQVTGEKATPEELKVLHKTIRKIEEDTERFSFNTSVSAFMVCVNELTDLKCTKREVLEPLLIILSPYAPHVSEELWHQLGNTTTVLDAPFPKFEPAYLVESSKEYPISINGKMRTQIDIALDATQQQVEAIVLANPVVQRWTEGKPPKKIIFVKGKMVNVVV